MNTLETKKICLTCQTCGVWEVTSALDEGPVSYFAVQRDTENASVGTISKAICRTCGSPAIIREHKHD